VASALYHATFVDKRGLVVKVELAIVHPDISTFGTDRLWAWKLLHEYVSPPDGGSDVELASRYVKKVSVAPVKNAKVAKKAADHFTVKRAGRKRPTVVYTIEVTDAELLADISKGDADDVYEFIEPGKGRALTPPPKRGTTGKARPADERPAPAGPAKLYTDLRDAALELMKRHPRSWQDFLIEKGMLQRWARGASEDEVLRWLESLGAAHQAKAAALLAIDRAKDPAAAKRLLRLAESRHDPEDSYNRSVSLPALVSAWWRLGAAKRADAGQKQLTGDLKQDDRNQRGHQLFTVAALGRRWESAAALVKECLNDGTEPEDLLVPGVVAAFAANEKEVFAAIMKKWSRHDRQCSELSVALLRLLLDRDEPHRYLELLLAYPKVIDDGTVASYALSRTEVTRAAAAVAVAEKLLARDPQHSDLHVQSIAILHRHAPKQAERWLRKQEAAGAPMLSYLAASGRDVRSKLGGASSWECVAIANLTPDRGLAIAALERAFDERRDPNPYLLVRLLDLGGRAMVDKLLDRSLKAIAKQPTKQRDVPCRYLAGAAVQVGRADLAFAAVKLPGAAMRQYTASDMVRSAVQVGDFTTALAALELVPDDDSNGRVSAALHALMEADEALFSGPRAIPLRAIDATYARGLIAAGDRQAMETILAIAPKDALDDEIRVEIDAFLEGRPFAAR
jgi:hypothetical protein